MACWRGSVLLILVACGGSSNSGGGDVTRFVGMYATTSHTHTRVFGETVSCSAPADPVPATDAMPFFRIDVDSFFMDPSILVVSDCSDAAGTSCHDTLVSLRAGGPGLQDENANSQTGGGVMCQLYFTHNDATLTGTSIQIEALSKFSAPDIASSDCTVARAEALSSSPDCQEVERWTGTRQ